VRLFTCRPEACNRLIVVLKEKDESMQEVVE